MNALSEIRSETLFRGEVNPFFEVAMHSTNGDTKLAVEVTQVFNWVLDKLIEHDVTAIPVGISRKTVPIENFERSSMAIIEDARCQLAKIYMSLPGINQAIDERVLDLSTV